VKAIVAENGFSDPYVSQATIPYMCSPASRHGRQERVFTFSAYKERNATKPERHRALPDWIVKGNDPVPLTASFRQQLESQRLMTKEEAEPAIRTFLTKMYDDAQKQAGF
jgi:hypothetical protein